MTITTSKINRNPKNILLEKDEVHVWSANLNLSEKQVKKLQLYLSADELQRAQRFYFARDQQHFIVARGVLRKILSHYLQRQPYEINFEYNRYGKPFLMRELGGDVFRFNLSHSHGLALYAITLRREIGVDVELIREDFSDLEIADRFFSPNEVSVLRSLPSENQREAFFLCWTRKEAFIKAKGKGLSIPLDQFDVSLAPGQPAALLKTRYDSNEASHWSLFNLTLNHPGYAAAVAVEGQKCRLKFWQWSEQV